VAAVQPAKAAAAAGYWSSGETAPWVLFGWPDAAAQRNRAQASIGRVPDGWLARDAAGRLQGLDGFSGMLPPVAGVFWSFRIVLLAGVAMALVAGITLAWLGRRRLDPSALPRAWLRVLAGSGWLGGLACV